MSDESKGTHRLLVHGLRLEWGEEDSALRQRAADKLGVRGDDFESVELLKRSLDARGRPRHVCSVIVTLDRLPANMPGDVREAPDPESLKQKKYRPKRKERVAVLGAGPAGLFCAHRLAEAGLEPILIDRGEAVETRGRDVSGLMHRGELKPDSNICFGEGGAGTWSDGKLYTRVNDVRVRHVLETIVELGGPSDILVKGKPHLGTDRLVALCKAFRARLTEEGCAVRYGTFVEGLTFSDEKGERRVVGVKVAGGEVISVDRVVMAFGHSGREMYEFLAAEKVAMEPKPFAVGFRVEHRQALINEIQYGKYADTEGLPTADYRLATNYGEGAQRRGIYSFCMCPGGQVVPSPTQPGGICVNGMSHASRRGHWANSALVVSVNPSDFGAFGDVEGIGRFDGVLDGMAFQREAERRAYEKGGGGFIAPAQRLTDFRDGKPSTTMRKSTYKPGVIEADLHGCYPDFVTDNLKRALADFEERMTGFVNDDAILIGVETRTSAPVQVVRDDATLQSVNVGGLYPCGEGSGYGGGIVSAAIDGLRVAEQILEELSE